jgi:hypothetical protein
MTYMEAQESADFESNEDIADTTFLLLLKSTLIVLNTNMSTPQKRPFSIADVITTPFPWSPNTKSTAVTSKNVYYQCYACKKVCTELGDLSKHWNATNDHPTRATWVNWKVHTFEKDGETGECTVILYAKKHPQPLTLARHRTLCGGSAR